SAGDRQAHPDSNITSKGQRCRPHNGEEKDRCGKGERDDSHSALLEFSRCAGKEEHCGKQNSVRQVLTGNATRVARFLLTDRSLSGRVCSFTRPLRFIKPWHKWMRI